MKRWLPFVVACAIATVLSGCEQSGLGPTAISREGSHLLLAVCESVDVSGIQIEVQTVDSDEWIPVLDSRGEIAIELGTTFNLSRAIEGLAGDPVSIDARSIRTAAITFLGTDNFGADFGDATKISDSEWLQTNGDVTTTPCPG